MLVRPSIRKKQKETATTLFYERSSGFPRRCVPSYKYYRFEVVLGEKVLLHQNFLRKRSPLSKAPSLCFPEFISGGLIQPKISLAASSSSSRQSLQTLISCPQSVSVVHLFSSPQKKHSAVFPQAAMLKDAMTTTRSNSIFCFISVLLLFTT